MIVATGSPPADPPPDGDPWSSLVDELAAARAELAHTRAAAKRADGRLQTAQTLLSALQQA